MHWTEKRRAKSNLGKALRSKDWQLYGWKDDDSDSMTDYYSPESWDGIATKNGFILCVDISNYLVNTYSGKEIFKTIHEKVNCGWCEGTGECPDGWTLQQAKENPQQFNRQHTQKMFPDKNVVALLTAVVSPLHFKPNGKEKCSKCHGLGIKLINPQQEFLFKWPAFQVNPPHRMWHIEKDNRILSSGTGLSGCTEINEHLEENGKRVKSHTERLIAKFEAVIGFMPQTAQPSNNNNGVKFLSYKGYPIISIPTGNGSDVRFGKVKAKAIISHIEDIRKFAIEVK